MNTVLILPNYLIRSDFGDPSDPPIGVASIAAVLEKNGHKVSIIDADAENLTIDAIKSRLKQLKPGVVGISCNYSPLHNPTLQIASMVKKEIGAFVVVGGNHATALSDYLLSSSSDFDCVIRGEGEMVMLELLDALDCKKSLSNIKGLSLKEGSRIINTPDAPLINDINELPLPAYHLLPMNIYRRYNINAARGCPFDCSYCAANIIFRRKVRYRSPIHVLDEIEYLVKNYGNKHFWFSDDTFNSDLKYTESLIKELISRNLKITWSCLARINKINREMLQKMIISGCSYISYGIESGNQGTLNKIGKNITVKEILNTLRITSEEGIKQYGFFIIGFPGENWQTIMDSYKLIYESRLDGAAFNILMPLPGTRLMSELVKNDLLELREIKWDYLFARTSKETYENYSAELVSRWTQISAKELIEACKIGHRLPEIFKYLANN